MLQLKASRLALIGTPGAAVGGVARRIVARPPHAAFDFVARSFFRNYQLWNPQVVELEPQGTRLAKVGARARQVTLDRGVAAESTFRIAALQPNRRLTLVGISQPFVSSYEFAPAATGTILTFSFELTEIDLTLRPFASVIRDALQEGADQTIDNLKLVLENPARRAFAARRLEMPRRGRRRLRLPRR